jgi:DnaK suppressor protein
MDHLSETQLTTLRTKLETERTELLERVESKAGELSEASTNEPQDIEDAAAAEAGSFRTNSLHERDRARLAEVEAALARMGDGSYGICEDSDEEIPYRRLEVEPTTRYTVAAQEQRERESGVRDPHAKEPIGY